MTEREKKIKLLEENRDRIIKGLKEKDRTWVGKIIKPTDIVFLTLLALELFKIDECLIEIKAQEEKEKQ